jgi:aminoglycoside phosphotransferase
MDVRFCRDVCPLPFGLVLKWSDGTRLEEVTDMKVARAAGFPVPLVISYGEHPDMPHAPVSILMTRVPGQQLRQAYGNMSDEERNNVSTGLKRMLDTMRQWSNPWSKEQVCSITGGPIRSVRVPLRIIGPYQSDFAFNNRLREEAAVHSAFDTQEEFDEALATARKMDDLHHSIVFTHGDLKNHNIRVHDGVISGFIDWEAAGWYLDYWGYTTAMRRTPQDFWWYDFATKLGGEAYEEEMECELALGALMWGCLDG